MLVCVNGTGSADWSDAILHESHVYRFFRHRRSPLKAHFHGLTTLAGNILDITDRAWRFLCQHPQGTRIDLVGFSRGAAIAVELAQRLNETGKRKVDFLGLFDAVDRSALDRTDEIPGNVVRCAHAIRDPNRHSRNFGIDFQNTGRSAASGVKYREQTFFTTHGGIGGACGDALLDVAGNAYGFFLKVANSANGFDVDVAGAHTAWSWMVLEARMAGVLDLQLLRSAQGA